MTKRPNFVVFMTDQHRADWLSCAGHPVLQTPNIDAIANSGTRFDNFFVAHPICMPNRASLITGRMPSAHGLRMNGLALDTNSNTIIDCLRRAGYITGLIGKGHHQTFSKMSPPSERGRWDTEPYTEALPMPMGDYYVQERWDLWANDPDHDLTYPYYGYSHVDLVSRHGDRTGGAHERWLMKNLPEYKELAGPDNQLPHDFERTDVVRTALPEEAYSTSFIRDRAIDFLKAHQDSDQPFFLLVSFPDPHHPFNPPGKYWDMYKPEDMVMPENFAGMSNPTPLYEEVRQYVPPEGAFRGRLEATTERGAREAMALTAGMIAMIDDAVGEVRSTIESSSWAGHTVQAFTTDHGDMMGDHALMLKGPVNLNPLVRVPFLWSDPQNQSVATSNAIASTIDIGPTILARAGVEGFNGIQGLDLAPALETGDTVRDQLLIEHDSHVPMAVTNDLVPRVRTLVTSEWKLNVTFDQPWGELFNRTNDPHEMQNLWDDPASQSVRAELFAALSQELIRVADPSPLPIGMG